MAGTRESEFLEEDHRAGVGIDGELFDLGGGEMEEAAEKKSDKDVRSFHFGNQGGGAAVIVVRGGGGRPGVLGRIMVFL